jgi:hypothetical protein
MVALLLGSFGALGALGALVGGGCGADCPTVSPPSPACVRVASSGPSLLVLLTPECGIVDEDVHVQALFTGGEYTLHVDADGRSPALSIMTFGGNDELVMSYGGDCNTSFCVRIGGAGIGRECTSLPADFAE